MATLAAPPPVRSRVLAAFVAAVIGGGGAVVIHSLFGLPQIPDPQSWALLSVLAVVTASFALKVPGVPVYLSISDAFFIAAGLLFGPAPAALTIAADSLIVSARRKAERRQLLFNVTSSALSLWCGVQVFYLLAGHEPMARSLRSPDERTILPLACLAVVYFALNSGLTAVAVALSKGASPWRFWREHFAVMSVNYLAAASAAYFLILLVRHAGAGALALVIPLLMVCHLAMRSWLGRVDDAQKHLQDVNRLYLSTISAFSTAIEAKDGVTSDHIHRVQGYAMGLARALGVADEPTLKAIEAAALLHDTGKLAIPEHILNKPGKLTAHEFETMKTHVDIGADILASIDFPYPVVPIVRAHHEHWNGNGYPRGLRGEEIPIGARILSVVDCFDALTSDRPYRPALSDAAALEIIRQSRGTMYDPQVVDTFAQRLQRHRSRPAAESRLDAVLGHVQGRQCGGVPAAGSDRGGRRRPRHGGRAGGAARLRQPGPAGCRHAHARRHRRARRAAHLRHVAPAPPWRCSGSTRPAASSRRSTSPGQAPPRCPDLAVRLGERLTGWVGANLRAMPNADARLDLRSTTPPDVRSAGACRWSPTARWSVCSRSMDREPFSDDQSRTVEMVAPQLAAAVAAVEAAATPTAEPARPARSGMRVVARR